MYDKIMFLRPHFNTCPVSSRAHTIVAITLTQKSPNESGESMTRTSTVNLVDLAGR